MSFLEKFFGSGKPGREVGGEPGQVATEALPQQQEEDLPITEKRIPSSAAAFRSELFKGSRTAQEIGGNIVDFNDYKAKKEELEEKANKIKSLYAFFKTAKENNITDPFALGELAANQEETEKNNLERAAELLAEKKTQKELFEAAEIPEADQEALAEAASKIILISKSKVREKFKHLG